MKEFDKSVKIIENRSKFVNFRNINIEQNSFHN